MGLSEGPELTLNDEPFASAMGALPLMSVERREVIGQRLLKLATATAEVIYSVGSSVVYLTWRDGLDLVAEGDTLFAPGSIAIFDDDGEVLVEWSPYIKRWHGEIVEPLLGLGEHVIGGQWEHDEETFDEGIARLLEER
jgi:hypothetical protein